MDVVLIEDKKNKRGAISLTVGAGGFEDPEETPGIAHLTQHMILLGSKEYPRPSEFEDHLSHFYGLTESFTEDEKTTYYFESNFEGFDHASYMFSRLLANPSFDREEIKRQIDLIQAEHLNILTKDQWKEHQIIKCFANPVHPYRNSGFGAYEKLSKHDDKHLIKLVNAFYNKYYTPHNMKLVVQCKLLYF